MNLIETYNGSGLYAQYATSADYASNGQALSAALTAVPDTYLQNTDLSTEDGKVTAISGMLLSAGGGSIPTGTMNVTALEYDASNKITAYDGSAFAGGSEIPAAVSGYWQSASDTVSANSGAWGGSALPVSAGPGIKFDMVDNTLVASTDETVLWSGAPTASTNTITVSENFSAFEKVDIYWKSYERRYVTTTFAESNTSPIVVGAVFVLTDGNYEKSMTLWNTSNGTTYSWASTIHGSFTGTQSNSWNSNVVPLKIIGINRK